LPLIAQAQEWEIRGGGGGTFMTLPNGQGSELWRQTDSKLKPALTAAGFLSVGRQFKSKHLVAGLRMGVASLKRLTDKDVPFVTSHSLTKPGGAYVGRPSLFFQPYASYQYKGFYGGVQVGVITWIGAGPDDKTSTRYTGSHIRFIGTSFVGFAGGVHGGYQLSLTKHWGVFADLSCNYIDCTSRYFTYRAEDHLQFFQPQGILGLSYMVRK